MFGVLSGSSCVLQNHERQEWMGHICGVCLALRNHSGHLSRIATNYDAALISVLCEAQTPMPLERYTSSCPLRRQFKAQITAPDSLAAQYAGSLALMMAATKIQDHIIDKETYLYRIPWLPQKLAQTWANLGKQAAQQLGFETKHIEMQTQRQTHIESSINHDFLFYTQPTELAVAAAFQHTAVIAQTPQNADILFELGRMFGRIMYLLDSYEDYISDLATEKFNALATCFNQDQIKEKTEQIFQAAYNRLKTLFFQLDLVRPNLVRKLLIAQLKQRSHHILEIHNRTPSHCRLPEHETEPAIRSTKSQWEKLAWVFNLEFDDSQEKRNRSSCWDNLTSCDCCCTGCDCCSCIDSICDCDCDTCGCEGCECCGCDCGCDCGCSCC